MTSPRQTQRQDVMRWWHQTRHYAQLSDKLTRTSAQDLGRVRNIDRVLLELEMQMHTVEDIYCPESATKLQRALLAFMTNLVAALRHTRIGNDDDRNVIFDIAMVDKQMLTLYLDEYGLSM
ncbi:MAG: hypothetical protein AAFV98_20330 [Chloroflexota bacterium]